MAVKKNKLRSVSEALGVEPFHPDAERRAITTILDIPFALLEAKIVEGYRSMYGESDFAILLLETLEADGTTSKFTTLCGGEVVVKKIRKLLADSLMPVNVLITKSDRYYDIV